MYVFSFLYKKKDLDDGTWVCMFVQAHLTVLWRSVLFSAGKFTFIFWKDEGRESLPTANWVLSGGFPDDSVIKNPYQCWRHQFNPWVGKVPWKRKLQPTPAFLPGKSQGQRSLAGNSPLQRRSPAPLNSTHNVLPINNNKKKTKPQTIENYFWVVN